MALIYETENFVVKSAELPHIYVSREDGGHLMVKAKGEYAERTQLPPELAIEYMKLTMVAGEAMKPVMARSRVEIGIINYQEMGNWSVFKPGGPRLHTHLFGRALHAAIQKYGEAVKLPNLDSGFYDNFMPLTASEVTQMTIEITKLLQTDKYRKF